MKQHELEAMRPQVAELIDGFNKGLQKINPELKLHTVLFTQDAVVQPHFCWINSAGDRVCFPPQH